MSNHYPRYDMQLTKVLKFSAVEVFDKGREFRLVFSADGKDLTRTFTSNVALENTPYPVVENVLFHAGLFCLMDYDQLLVPERVEIAAGKLDEQQLAFYKNVRNQYARQLFFERRMPLSLLTNNIATTEKTFPVFTHQLDESKMIGAYGGGKESTLYRLLLRRHGVEPLWFLRTREKFRHTLQGIAVQNHLTHYAHVNEDIDLYSNGYADKSYHSRTNTGISLYIMMMTLFALEHGYGQICLGNEKSAEDPYCLWDGLIVNHQFDKTAMYREQIGRYINRYIAPELNLFSIFEGLYEYKLVQLMRQFPAESFRHISSCNYMTNDKPWCHLCPKCAWTFAILSYAFGHEHAIATVGKDLFQEPQRYEEILNPNLRKPFECVGERPEIWLILDDCRKAGQRGPLLDYVAKHYLDGLAGTLEHYRIKYEQIYANPKMPSWLNGIFSYDSIAK